MQITKKIIETKNICRNERMAGKTIGFVPTMGFLHEGHLSLVRQARSDNDFVAVSIFVNPTQFSPNEDFNHYPRKLDRDIELLEAENIDLLFVPPIDELYPGKNRTFVEVDGELSKKLCGGSRPGHFRGVATIVAKFFNIIDPDRAYFGEKDAQQLAVLRRMVSELNFDIEIVSMPIVREIDGLALSSRNSHLNSSESRSAVVLFQALRQAEKLIENGERNPNLVVRKMTEMIEAEKCAEIDYIEIVSVKDFEPIEEIDGEIVIALAVFIGKTRLIDNITLLV